MHLINHSHVPDAFLQGIADTIEMDFKHSHRVILYVHTEKKNPVFSTSGMAYKKAPTIFNNLIQFGFDSLIVLSLSQHTPFPFFSKYVAEVPGIEVMSMEEDVLLVMAHELRHIDQFWESRVIETNKHLAEIDAERHAVATLIKYRSRFNQKRAA